MKRRRIIVNNDYFNIFQVKQPVTEKDIHDAVDRMVAPAVKGSQVDALFLLVDEDMESSLDARLVKLYDHPDVDPSLNALRAFQARGKDPYGMVVARAKQKKIDIFASVRMNDTHYKDQPFNPWLPPFYYDNLHNRLTPSATMDGTRNNTEFDYRKTVVRDHYFNIIKTAVEKYDLDGVEMDFTRNCKYFPDPNREECAPVMTEFVRRVREFLDAQGKKKKRRIELAVTTPYSLYRTRLEGLDITTWARLGYIDLVCMSTPFSVDTGRDIADTVAKLGGVPVYAGCDRNFQWPGRPFPKEAYRAMAITALHQGAAGFYAYNVMHWTIRLEEMPEILKLQGGQSNSVQDACLMSELGEIASLERLDKLYIVSHGPEVVDKPYASLPVTVPALGEVTLRIDVGEDIAADAAEDAIERIWVQAVSPDCGNYNNYTLKLNGIDLARQYAFLPYATKPESRFIFPEPENTQPAVPPENVRRHPARAIDLHRGVNFVTIKSWKDAMTISDVEIGIVYRKK
ncbi:MAG: hypothetical protein K8S99_18160 [Planctomycetes bacterium]|nr:hypothetical protein [Planctomycetota bacterium]